MWETIWKISFVFENRRSIFFYNCQEYNHHWINEYLHIQCESVTCNKFSKSNIFIFWKKTRTRRFVFIQCVQNLRYDVINNFLNGDPTFLLTIFKPYITLHVTIKFQINIKQKRLISKIKIQFYYYQRFSNFKKIEYLGIYISGFVYVWYFIRQIKLPTWKIGPFPYAKSKFVVGIFLVRIE